MGGSGEPTRIGRVAGRDKALGGVYGLPVPWGNRTRDGRWRLPGLRAGNAAIDRSALGVA